MEKLILLWLPLQGDVQRRQHFSRAILLSFVKLISTCDLKWGEVLPLTAKKSWDLAVLSHHWGKLLYHCTVWQANYIGDAIRTLIAFSMNFSHTQRVIKQGTDLSQSRRCTCVYLGKSLSQTGQQKSRSTLPDWLKTTEVARNGGMYLNKTASDVLCEAFVSFNTFSLSKWVISQVKKYKTTNLTETSPCSADKKKCVLWSIKKAQAVQLYIQTRKDSVAFLTV